MFEPALCSLFTRVLADGFEASRVAAARSVGGLWFTAFDLERSAAPPCSQIGFAAPNTPNRCAGEGFAGGFFARLDETAAIRTSSGEAESDRSTHVGATATSGQAVAA